MGAVTLRILYIDSGTPESLLEISHHIQMADKAHNTFFSKFNSYLQSRHLLRKSDSHSQNIACGSLASRFLSVTEYIPAIKILLSLRRQQNPMEGFHHTREYGQYKMPDRFCIHPWLPAIGHNENTRTRNQTYTLFYRLYKYLHRLFGPLWLISLPGLSDLNHASYIAYSFG